MKPDTFEFENKAREIIGTEFKAFVEVLDAEVNKSVKLPDNDPGQWAPRSLLVVTHEHGIPGPMDYETDVSDIWKRVEEKLSKALGKPVFFEPINQAVSALYWA